MTTGVNHPPPPVGDEPAGSTPAVANRPRAVTVIGGIFIFFGASMLLLWLFGPQSAEAARLSARLWAEHPIIYAQLRAGPVVALVCGIALLRGWNWGRWLLLVWFGNNVINNAFRGAQVQSFAVVGLFAIVIYYLFNARARAYFLKLPPPTDGKSPSLPTPQGQ